MNMKKMKKFFTLARRHDGFTLVELIVVIAILAILGGVAVPAYSGYVKKANMQADISLAAEVADALTLYYYSHPGEVTDGYVVLTPGTAACQADGAGDPAMVAVFGEEWEKSLSLKHGEWAADSGYGNVGNSALVNVDAKEITGAVTGLTGLASAVIGSNDPAMATKIIGAMFGDSGAAITEELKKYEGDEAYSTIASNLLVKYFAEDIGGATFDTDEDGEQMVVGMEGMSSVGATYAMIYAMANSDSEYKDVAQAKLDAFDAELASIAEREGKDPNETHVQEDVFNALGNLLSDPNVDEATGKTFGQAYDEFANANDGAQMAAIIEAMSMVDSISDGFTEEALRDSKMFESNAMVNLLEAYKLAASTNGIVITIDSGIVNMIPSVLKGET